MRDLFGKSVSENLNVLARRGPGTNVWDNSLRMGFTVYSDGSRQFFRYPSVSPHPECKNPTPVTDDEFRSFMKLHQG